MTFDYHQIVEIRVAVSEVFGLAMRRVVWQKWSSENIGLSVCLMLQPGRLEILSATQSDYADHHAIPAGVTGHIGELDAGEPRDQEESLALLRSLMDKVEFGKEGAEVRMVKYGSVGGDANNLISNGSGRRSYPAST
jgi:hypothetical protein